MNKLITDLKKKKNKISVYGASGKGQALMHFAKIDNNLIDYGFDKRKFHEDRKPPRNLPNPQPHHLLQQAMRWNDQFYFRPRNSILFPIASPILISRLKGFSKPAVKKKNG